MKNISALGLLFITYFSLFNFECSAVKVFGTEGKKSETLEIEPINEVKEFESIKNIIKNDLLEEEVKKRTKVIIQKKEEVKRINIEKYNYPTKNDFWSFMSEYWLVKNAQKLHWDFEKPDYGLQDAFKEILEKLGYFEKRVKILLLKNPEVTHFSLPADDNESIFIISQPFIRTMDLTKLEISMLLLEDFFRNESGFFKQFVAEKELVESLGKNFHGQVINVEILKKILRNYDHMVYKKGFTFQQQYEITQKMDMVLKNHIPLWGAYNTLLSKIDVLVKSNALYKEYSKFYPSPEFQLKWLQPESKRP